MKHYNESLRQYEMSLMLKKSHTLITQYENKDPHEIEIVVGIIENFSEVEIKFRMAKCLIENHQFKEAIALLNNIPFRQRPAKVNMLLAKLQHSDSGTDKNIITAYKEVLKKCPLAFECIDALLLLGVKGAEINSLIIDVSEESFEWINFYIKGVSEIYNRKYSDAITTLTSIDCMKTNPKILATIGECFYFNGDYERAYTYLKKSYNLYPFMKQGIQKLALLCDIFKKNQELEQLIRPSSTHPYEYSSENWFVMATYLYSCLKFDKALYFIHRVIGQYQQKNVDALILNGKILHSNKKSLEAISSLRQALKYEPYRFEAIRWIVEILMTLDKVKEAQNQATKFLKQAGDSPRTLTLTASTFLKNPMNKEKAKGLLQKALEMNESYSKAVFFLAQILIEEKDMKEAIKLLEKSCPLMTNVKVNLLLADLYAKNKNLTGALQQYTKVLNIDSTNKCALSRLTELGSIKGNTVIEAEEDSDTSRSNRNDDEASPVWSDLDLMEQS
jgi:anaphase-promoting complex subunit 7